MMHAHPAAFHGQHSEAVPLLPARTRVAPHRGAVPSYAVASAEPAQWCQRVAIPAAASSSSKQPSVQGASPESLTTGSRVPMSTRLCVRSCIRSQMRAEAPVRGSSMSCGAL